MRYPATAALMNIGDPAVSGLFKKVAAAETTALYRRVAVGVIVEVLGKEKALSAIAEFEVEKGKPNTSVQKNRLDTFKKELMEKHK